MSWRSRFRWLLRRDPSQRELDEEIRAHLELEAEARREAGAGGEEAYRAARKDFGNLALAREDARAEWGLVWLEAIWRDLRLGMRSLARDRRFTAVAVLSLALGIGANTAIFTLMHAVMWRSLPIPEPDGLFALVRETSAGRELGFSYEEFRGLREDGSVARVAGYSPATFNVSVDGTAEPAIQGLLVSGDFFSLVGARPVVGRAIGPEEDVTPNGHPVVMLSYGYWERRFGRAPDVVGRTVHLLGEPFTVIGVAPRGFFGVEIGTSPEVYAPLMMQPALMPSFENLLSDSRIYRSWIKGVTRIQGGIPPERAAASLSVLYARAKAAELTARGLRASPQIDHNDVVRLTPASAVSQLESQFSRPLTVLMVVVALVLLIACANTANLLLARAVVRRSELSLRLALGAGRAALVRQLLAESLVLAALSGVLGMMLAYWATRTLVQFISTGRAPVVLDLSPNPRVLAFALALSCLTAVLFGLAPALRSTRRNLQASLGGLRRMASPARENLRSQKLLAAAQVAVSLVLLVGAGMFARSLANLNGEREQVPRGSVIVARVEPRGSDQRGVPGTSQRLDRTYRQLIRAVGDIPGVRSASMAQGTPTYSAGQASSPVSTASGDEVRVPQLMTYPGYFQSVGVPLIAGRDFDESDLGENAEVVCVVNEAFVREVLANENPIGRSVLMKGRGWENRPRPTIIGVVRDSRFVNPREKARPLMFSPFLQTPSGRGQMVLYVRSGVPLAGLLPRIREEIAKVDPSLPIFDVHTLEEEMDAALVSQRLTAILSSLFAGLALLLACLGLYGLLAFLTAQRRGEIGVRMALGARRDGVVWLVMRQALALVATGVGLGLPVALIVGRIAVARAPDLLFEVEAFDPATMATATAVLLTVVSVAAYLPAIRAARVDPMEALRAE